MDLIRFLKDFFHVDGSGTTAVKYAQGQTYPATEETTSQVAAGVAEVVTVVEGASLSDQPEGDTTDVTAPTV